VATKKADRDEHDRPLLEIEIQHCAVSTARRIKSLS